TSVDFPTANALQATYGGGGSDAFVAKLNPSGSALVYSTYLGGSGDDGSTAIAVYGSGSAYVTGFTNSPNLATANAFQKTLKGAPGSCGRASLPCSGVFAAKFNTGGMSLVYFTYLGGTGGDVGRVLPWIHPATLT